MNNIKRCRVCGDHATGFNYQGLSCESCKVFFHRNANKIEKLKCRKSTNICLIDISSRRKCSKCRMDKCLQNGMVKDSIKKCEDKSTTESLVSNSSEIDAISKIDILKEILFGTLYECKRLTILNKSVTSLNPVEQQRIAQVRTISGDAFIDERSLQNFRPARNIYDGYDSPELYTKMVIQFCKRMEGFSALKSEDQFAILKPFCFEIMNIRFTYDYDMVNDSVIFISKENGILEGIIYTSEFDKEFKNQEIIEVNKQFAIELNQEMENDDTIRDLLSALLLFKERTNLSSREFVRYQYALYSRLLQRYLEHKYKSHREANAKYSKLMKLLSRFEDIKNNERILMKELDLNQLSRVFIEIYDLA